jgi:hypothetical protein
MRRFWSYGTIDLEDHYYAPREELIEKACSQLSGINPEKGGHYITVWAPRQTGKSWVMQQVLYRLKKETRFDVIKIDLQDLQDVTNVTEIINSTAENIGKQLGKDFSGIRSQGEFGKIFEKGTLDKPLILIIDEFDSLAPKAIQSIVRVFRKIYSVRRDEIHLTTEQKSYLLHSVALIGIRSVLGIENKTGSPFNVQRSVHIPNLTYEEVKNMFRWYEEESGQEFQTAVIDRLYYETQGQPGLTCWFGELLTETYNEDKSKPITLDNLEEVLAAAIKILPNNNILNIISKANDKKHKTQVLELFKTDQKIEFSYDDKSMNFLYMNGVIGIEKETRTQYYAKFSCPFVQKRLFNYFSRDIFRQMGELVDPFLNLDRVITPTHLEVPELLKLYQTYLDKNRNWLFDEAPRRRDLRLFEAVFHFNLYTYINNFLRSKNGRVFPEFPAGNGKIDLLIRYQNVTYGLELKSFVDHTGYQEALKQAARYCKQLRLARIYLVFFVESIDEKNRQIYEKDYRDPDMGVTVHSIFIRTGG